ncbi:MAG: hypothetical protein OHK0046_43330 [Anaerolineae bacterium]
MELSGDPNMLDQVRNYRKIVLIYEALNNKIAELLHEGGTEHLSAEALDEYRNLARQRDELQNELRWLEQQLLNEDESTQQ